MHRPDPRYTLEVVAEEFDVSRLQILGPGRARAVTWARNMTAVIYERHGYSAEEIRGLLHYPPNANVVDIIREAKAKIKATPHLVQHAKNIKAKLTQPPEDYQI